MILKAPANQTRTLSARGQELEEFGYATINRRRVTHSARLPDFIASRKEGNPLFTETRVCAKTDDV